MKKIIAMLTLSAAILLAFCGCSQNSNTLKDGTYKASFASPDSHGWTEYVEITVESQKIKTVNFDSVNAEGKKKSEDEEYKKAMQNAGSPTYPADYCKKLATQLVDKQDINSVDTVAGATTSSDNFKKLVKKLEENMKSGNTAEMKVS